jgi:diadenosine tetraphosphate (Ap4A) HIT family hydrolase
MNDFELHPRLVKDTFAVANLNLCKLLLMNDSNYPWFILVPRIKNISELFELTKVDRQSLNNEVDELSRRLSLHFNAKKMNVAAMGNIVPQLHIHVIVRKETDAAWPNPIWNKVDIAPYKKNISIELIKDIKIIIEDLIVNDKSI